MRAHVDLGHCPGGSINDSNVRVFICREEDGVAVGIDDDFICAAGFEAGDGVCGPVDADLRVAIGVGHINLVGGFICGNDVRV